MKALQLLMITFCLLTLSAICAVGLEDEFRDTPDSAKPWVYWINMDGHLTKEGITADFESMKEVGIDHRPS